MSKLTIAVGGARTGKTFQGQEWVDEEPSYRVMLDYGSPRDVKRITEYLDDEIDVWVCVNGARVPRELVELGAGYDLDIRHFPREGDFR